MFLSTTNGAAVIWRLFPFFGGDEAIFALSAPFFLQRLGYNDHTAFEGNAKQTARGRCY